MYISGIPHERRVNDISSTHSALQEALCEDEGESGSVPLSRPHVRQPKAIHQGA